MEHPCTVCGRPARVTVVGESASPWYYCLDCADKRTEVGRPVAKGILAFLPGALIRGGALLGVLALVADYLHIAGREGFGWKQIRLALAVFAGLLMLGFLIVDGPDKGIGFWLMLLGAIALVAGAVMETIGYDPQAAKAGGGAAPGAPGAAPPTPPTPPSPPPGSPPPPPPPSA
jgi:hypothetical protein